METIDVGSIKQGDRISFLYPTMTVSRTLRVEALVGYGHSTGFDAPYVDFFSEHHSQHAVALPFITHRNGRRVSQEYWSGRNPALVLNRGEQKAENKKIVVSQMRMPFNEEDDLANLKTSTRKSLDEMSESHRAHIEKWEPHITALGAEHVWASANRFGGRGGEGPVYVAAKRASKDYAILDYDTATKKKAKVLVDGFESSKTLLEAFKEYREMAKAQRQADKPSKPKKAEPAKGTKKVAKKAANAPAAEKPAKAKKLVRKK